MSSKSGSSLPRIESRFVSSSTSSNALTIAAERWNVEKKRIELDEDIEKFYNAQVAKCLSIDKVANERITKFYNDIYYKVKWSNPPLPAPIQKLYTEYCKHLLTEGPKAKFAPMVDLKVWKKKVRGSVHDKAFGEIEKQCKTLKDIISKRDTDLIETQATLLSTTEKKNVKKDGTLRWMMESNVGKKDEYFTIWYLAANCKIRELDVLLNAPSKQVHIDQRDPDFGLTPLHYACKSVKLSMVQYLMANGADLSLRTPDGRTVLHLAAAYSTREIVQELLGACVDYDAVDNYGCTALQMAVQNKNAKTMGILGNWNKLTLLPEELAALHQQEQLTQSLLAASQSKLHSSSVEIGFESMMSKLSPSRGVGFPTTTTSSALAQDSVYVDPSIPEEYQPIPADTLKLMSPTLSLLTKRLNAYNMYFVRNEANYVPTEMLRSRDLSNISEALYRSAAQAESLAYGSLSATPTFSREPSVAGDGYNNNFGQSGLQDPSTARSQQVDYPASVDSYIYLDTGESHQNDTQESTQLDIQTGPLTGSPARGLQNFSFRSIFDNQMFNPSDIFRSGSSSMENNDFGTLFNECLVEIRLVSKHYALCVQENLLDEAMRSLRRRWLVAKRLWDLIVQEKKRKREAEEERRAQQERDMEALLSQQENYNVTYNEAGEPTWHNAGLLEQSTLHEGSSQWENSEFAPIRTHPQLLENSSELAMQPSYPSPPRLLLDRSSTTAGDGVGLRSPSRYGPDSPLTINPGQFTDSNLDINPIIPGTVQQPDGQNQEDEEESQSESSSAYTGPAPLDLERIARAYEEQCAADRLAENNPDIENQSTSSLRRPTDYDSIGVAVYKVKDNVYWETESSNQRLHAPPLSADSSSGLTSPSLARNHTSEGPRSPLQTTPSDPTSGGGIAETGQAEGEQQEEAPAGIQDTNAWDVIQKWHDVADERAKRRPNFDTYYSHNDDLMSTTSLLTFSVTEAPSTGAHTLRSPSGFTQYPDSPSGSSLNSVSYMFSQVQLYNYASGPFKDDVRGNYVIKLGLDLMNVYLARKEEGKALRILHECCVINDEVEITQKITLLEKKTDLLLHMHDTLERTLVAIDTALQNEGKEKRPRIKLHFPTARVVPSVRTIVTERIQGMLTAATWVEKDLAQRLQNNSLVEEEVKYVDLENSADYFAVLRAQPSLQEIAARGDEHRAASLHPSESLVFSNGFNESFGSLQLESNPTSMMDAHNDDYSIASNPQLLNTGTLTNVTFADPVDDRDALRTETFAAIEHIKSVQKSLLQQCVTTTETSVALHREHYKTDIAEPSSLAVALLQRARVAERDYNGAQAMEFIETAEVAAVRALGGGSQLAIGIMLESLRLYVKYQLQDAPDLKYINARAHEINKYIVQFSFTDLALADKFTQKCFEYLSICTVAVKHQQDEAARVVAAAKLAQEREARRKIVEAQASVMKSKR